MGKCKNAARGGANTQKGTSPTPSSHRGEERSHRQCSSWSEGWCGFIGGRTLTDGCSIQDALQIHAIQLIAIWMISIIWALTRSPCTQKSETCYYIHLGLTLGEGGGDWPPPSHAWSGLLIADMFQDESWRKNYRSCSPCLQGRQSYSLDDMITQRGAPLGKCQGCQIQLDRPSQLGQAEWCR